MGPRIVRPLTLILNPKSMVTTCPNTMAIDRGFPPVFPHEYHGTPVPEQHTRIQLVHRAATLPRQAYYVSEAGNPDVAMTASLVPAQDQLSQQVERPSMELPYSAPDITTSIQSRPSTFSGTSVPGPMIPEGFYTHQPGSQPTYTAAESQPAMIQYQQPIQHHMAQPQQPVVSHAQHIPATTGHFAPPPAHPQQEQWSHYDPRDRSYNYWAASSLQNGGL
ncbi:hypothetical protein IL306_004774 [Fusarium sp. DS 682]|nr:hypothetical protein IL306_004774 [Fusarium sp. DS 682]